jgi:SepF-like predicted cell division protein (DUF552 family)
MVFEKIRKAFSSSEDSMQEEYMELDLDSKKEATHKVLVKLFTIRKYEDTNRILNALREGYTIAIVDFKVLKQKDPIELKRAVAKLKKTIDALEGSIAGHDNFLVITPAFAKIYKEVEEMPSGKPEEKQFE